jgi:hypothetical protein
MNVLEKRVDITHQLEVQRSVNLDSPVIVVVQSVLRISWYGGHNGCEE